MDIAQPYLDAFMAAATEEGSPLPIGLLALAAVTVWCWVASIVTGNCSQVDRLWSIVPFCYVWIFYAYSDNNPRILAMAVLTTIWGTRLTINFARKGGYQSGHEDYRWPVLRTKMSWLVYQIFNFFFVAIYQNILLFTLAVPAYTAWVHRDVPLNNLDFVAIGLFLAMLVLETAADQQQWNFHQQKHKAKTSKAATSGDVKRGFLTKGLFSLSRHPNFFAEQSMWWAIGIFALAACGNCYVQAFAGALQLTLLFQGSTDFTEEITLSKYPEYAKYQKTTSRLIPWFPGPSLDKKD